ncbi:MAG: hypothetical protein KME16_28355 [Scytolyngbya sp. HA4215-MV1]|jgi:succinate dehydrogenase hydrophobic anchor subunit|nr:hypothetical protein [Scytolyngbya sp. HA4215-MV1]
METLILVLTHSYFKNICIPLVALVVTVLFKAISKKDGYRIEKNDYAIGFDLLASAFLLFVTGMIDLASKLLKVKELTGTILTRETQSIQALQNFKEEVEHVYSKSFMAVLIILFLVLILVFTPSFVRDQGWNNNGDLKWIQGVIIPVLLGLVFFTTVVIWIGE